MEEVEIIALLIKIRKEKKVSKNDMAVGLGVSLDQYSKYESMYSKLSLDKFIRALSILELDINSFFNINSNVTKEEIKSINEKLNEVLDIVNAKS